MQELAVSKVVVSNQLPGTSPYLTVNVNIVSVDGTNRHGLQIEDVNLSRPPFPSPIFLLP